MRKGETQVSELNTSGSLSRSGRSMSSTRSQSPELPTIHEDSVLQQFVDFTEMLRRNDKNEIARHIVSPSFNPSLVHPATDDTFLHIAARNGNKSLAWGLLALGANPNAINKKSVRALDIAISDQNSRLVHTIANDPRCKVDVDDLKKAKSFSLTFQELECAYARKLVIAYCKQPNNSEYYDAFKSLLLDRDSAVTSAITVIDDSDVLYGSKKGVDFNTIAHYAASHYNLRLLELVKRHGARADAKNSDGKTYDDLLKEARAKYRPEIEKRCFKIIKERSYDKKRPLDELKELLYDYKSETVVNIKDENGNTLLHHAVFAGDRELTQLLINWGADVAIKNNEDKKAVDLLTPGRYQDLRTLLCSIEKKALLNTFTYLLQTDSQNNPRKYKICLDAIKEGGTQRQALLKHINSVFYPDTGNTLLHATVLNHNPMLTDLLLEAGADSFKANLAGILPHQVHSKMGSASKSSSKGGGASAGR